METIKIEGQLRSEINKKATKAVRATGNIPCVMYGGAEVKHFVASPKAFKHAIYTPDFKLIEVSIDGKTTQCIIKDTQFHPVNDSLMHVDLLELVPGQVFNAQVPVTYEGASPGVKIGGKLMKKIRRVKVKMTPETMVDNLTIDISKLELGFSVRVKELNVQEGVVVTDPPNAPIASVEVPRALKSADASADAAEDAPAEEETAEAAAE